MKTIGLKPRKMREYIVDMIKALYYCHNVIGLIHRDIKPDNIMINHNDEAVLIDFGVSALVEETDQNYLQQNIGSYVFFAPEMFKKKDEKELGANVDIWALGITMFYMVTGKYPHSEAGTDLEDL